jgi:ATP-dependent DNA ligase
MSFGLWVRLWARTTSDYSSAFARIREAVAALPVDNAVLDGQAVVRSRQGQASWSPMT